MTPEVTVLIPTFDHGALLRRSVGSVLRQSVTDFEVLVVGDGAPDETRAVMAELVTDPRVRFLDNRAKGEHHGELYRHEALGQARGRVVCYLADDDLYLPDHLEVMLALLREADFAHTLPFRVERGGGFFVLDLDLSLRSHRWLQAGRPAVNRLPLSLVGHTLELYRRAPRGWSVTPRGLSIPLYAWRPLIGAADGRVKSGFEPTVLHFPSLDRRDMTLADREVELDLWVSRSQEPGFRAELARELLRERAATAARRSVPAALGTGCLLSVVPFPAFWGRVRRLARGRER